MKFDNNRPREFQRRSCLQLLTDGRTDDGRKTEPAYLISTPGAFDSGELKRSCIH